MSPAAVPEDILPIVEPARKARPIPKARPAPWDRRWVVVAGGGAVLLLVLLMGLSITLVSLWAGGVFKGRAKDGVAVAGRDSLVPREQGQPDPVPDEPGRQKKADAGPPIEGRSSAPSAAAQPLQGKAELEGTRNNGVIDNQRRHSVKIGDTWFDRDRPADPPKEPMVSAPAKPPSASDKKPPAAGNKPDRPGSGAVDKPDPKVAADPKNKPEPRPEDGAEAERKASSQLRQVKEDLFGGQQVDRLRLNSAREDLQEIIKKYPKTEAAAEAKKLLDRLNGDDP